MFDFIRNHKRWMQFILLLLILPSFVFVGVHGYTTYVSQDQDVAVVDGKPITRQMFDRMLSNVLEQERRRLKESYDPAQIDTPALRAALIDSMLAQVAVSQAASNFRFSASDEALRRYIAQQPSFHENGRFSPQRYRDVLARRGQSAADYEAGLRGQLAIARVLEPIATTQDPWNPVSSMRESSVRVPGQLVRALYEAMHETREIRIQSFNAAEFAPGIEVSDADIQQWYEANGESLRLPESVDVQYVVLDEATARAGVDVSDDDILSYYEQNRSLYGTPERRRARHIQITVPEGASQAERDAALARAQALADQAREHPENFEALAREQSQDIGSAANGGDLGWIERNSFPVASVAEAVYGLPAAGAISDPVASRFGYHVIQLSVLEPAQAQPFDEVRDVIASEVLTQKASARFAEQAQTLNNLIYGGQRDSLQPIADALNLKLQRANGIGRNALLAANDVEAPAAAASADAAWLGSARVRQAVFANDVLKNAQNTGVIEIAPNTLLALRVMDVRPSAIPPLSKVRDDIHARLLESRAIEAARAAGEKALAEYQAKRPDPLPAGFGAALQVSRERALGLQPALLNAITSVDPEQVPAFVGVVNGPNFHVVEVAKVTSAGEPDAEAFNMLRAQLDYLLSEGQKGATLQALQQSLDAKLLPEAQRVIAGASSDATDN